MTTKTFSKSSIPVLTQEHELNKHDYPITPGENLMRALSHEKPLWMPNLYGDSQIPPWLDTTVKIPGPGYDFKDWFGVGCKYSEAQGSATPVVPALSEVSKWETELVWPDLKNYDLATPNPDFVRDPTRLLYTWNPLSCFQQLFVLEGFEQALIDLISEPKKCRELFEALIDFGCKVFDEINKAYNFDYVFYSDDWGTMRAPFFSVDLMKETLLSPTIRAVRHIKESGTKVLFHNCGMIDDFLPYIIEEVQPDAMDLQWINDIKGFMKKYGSSVTLDIQRPDELFFFDPNTSIDDIRAKAREYVDIYGATAMPGSGGVMVHNSLDLERANAFWDELYKYSLEEYRIMI